MPLGGRSRELLVRRGGTASPPVRLDAYRDAASLLDEDREAFCVAIEVDDAPQHAEVLAEAHDRTAELIQLMQLEPAEDVATSSGAYWLQGGLLDRSGVRVVTVVTPRLLHVHVQALQSMRVWEEAEPAGAWILAETSRACASSEASTERVALTLHSRVVGETLRRLRQDGRRMAASARSAVRGDSDLLTASVDRLFGYRQDLTELAEFLQEAGDDILLEAVHRSTIETDALGNFLAGAILARLMEREQVRQRAHEEERRERDARQRVEEGRRKARDQALARVAAALLLPTMWITYWSTKPAPELSTLWGSASVWLGAIVAGVVGYLAAGYFMEFEARRKSGDAE